MSSLLPVLATAGIVLAADVASKVAVSRLPATGVGHPSLGLRRVVNRRGSLLGIRTDVATGLLVAVVIAMLLVVSQADVGTPVGVACGLLLGGAAGNLVDRLRSDGVVDFVVVGRWPPFNIADIALVVGTVLVPLTLA